MEKKTNFKELTTKAKFQYIWDYYRWHILVTLCVLAFFLYSLFHFFTDKKPVLHVIMVNCYNNLSNDTSGFDDFMLQEGFNLKKECVSLTNSLTEMMDDIDATGLSDYDSLTLRLTAGGEDCFFATEEIYQQYAELGCMENLTTLFPQDFLDKYAESLVYTTDSETGSTYPCGICLKDNLWIDTYHYYDSECYFGILTKADHLESACDFLEYVLQYQ